MRKQWLFGCLAALALLISLSVAACIQPITAEGVQTRAVAQAATTEATEAINKAAVRDWFAALNSHDLARIDRAVDKYYAKDHVVHNPNLPVGTGGPEDIKRLIREFLQAAPDFHITVEDVIAEGDIVATRTSSSGDDPNDPTATLTVLNISRFVDGQYAEEWELP